MTIYDVLTWMLCYGLFLLFAAMAINGLHITTRGETETLPDGSTGKVNDMIFYPLLELVKKVKGYKHIYYQGEELKKLQRTLAKKFPLPSPDAIEQDHLLYTNGKSVLTVQLWREQPSEYLQEQEIMLYAQIEADPEQVKIRFYKEYPIYYLPKYVRKPLLECIKCMASVWGTLIFWPFVLTLFPFHPVMIPIWIVFCFSLSWVNTFLYHKAN